MSRRWLVFPVVVGLLLTGLAQPAIAAAAQSVVRVSASTTGTEPDASSIEPVISHDGSEVVFNSYATNLVSPAPAATPQVYAVAAAGGQAELVSVNNSGQPADGDSEGASTAGDGRYVVFQSSADNLVPYSGSPRAQIYLRDRLLHTTVLVSVNDAGVAGDGASANATVSADGRYVAFWSTSTNLGGSPFWTVYLRDLVEGTTIMIPVPGPPGSVSYNQLPHLSDDGSVVAFTSSTFDASGNELNADQALVYNTATGTTTDASVTNSGDPANGESVASYVSGDGRYVVFHSRATNLTTVSGLSDAQVYVRDTVAGTTQLVSSENANRNLTSAFGYISDDGRYAVYSSGYGSGTQLIVEHDLVAGTTTTLTDTGIQWGSTALATEDGSGQQIAFPSLYALDSSGEEADPGVYNGSEDIYVAGPTDTVPPTVTGTASQAPNANGWSPIGTTITWTSTDPAPSSGTPTTPAPTVVSTEGANQVITSPESCDPAGNCSVGTYTISVDATPPTLSASTSQQSQQGSGWFNSDVVFHWSCSDAISGIQTGCPADSVVTGEGVGLSANSTVSDRAGNVTTASTPAVNIDRTPPVTQASSQSGWINHDVTVTLTATDNLSGVAATYYSLDGHAGTEGTSVLVSGQGIHTLTYWSVDVAGNAEVPKTAVVQLDYNGPTIATTLSPLPNSTGWNKSPVTVTTQCADALSGIVACSSPVTFSHDGANQSVTVGGTNGAGTSVSQLVTVNVDTTPPVVHVIGATNLSSYGLANQPTTSCTTSDATSGVAMPAQITSTRNATGVYTAACAGATDTAGNAAATVAVTYTVTPTLQSLLALTVQYINADNVKHPLLVKAAASALLILDPCAYIAGIKAYAATGVLTVAQSNDLVYWAGVLDPRCGA